MTYLDIRVPPRVEEDNVVARGDVQPYTAGFHGHEHGLDIWIVRNGPKCLCSLSGIHSTVKLDKPNPIIFQKLSENIQQ